jgi:hypothetical protein
MAVHFDDMYWTARERQRRLLAEALSLTDPGEPEPEPEPAPLPDRRVRLLRALQAGYLEVDEVLTLLAS